MNRMTRKGRRPSPKVEVCEPVPALQITHDLLLFSDEESSSILQRLHGCSSTVNLRGFSFDSAQNTTERNTKQLNTKRQWMIFILLLNFKISGVSISLTTCSI